jgi:hypothetical protein
VRFDPVQLSKPLDGKVSVTMARAFNACRRAGFLYAEEKGGASEPQLERGSAFHAIMERSTVHAIDLGEGYIPSDLVKVFCDEVLADPEFHVPLEEHDYIRECAWRAASFTTFDPTWTMVERLFQVQLGDWVLRAKIDFLELIERGAAVRIEDYKTARAAASYDDIGRRLPKKGRIAVKDFQLVSYVVAAVFGVPVRVEVNALGERRETPEPFPVADRVQRADVAYVYPGIEEKATGGPVRRDMSLTRVEMEEYKASLEGLLVRLSHAEATGDWRAIQGEGHCGECPAPKKCPIPPALRKWAPEVDTREEAAAEAQSIELEAAALKARRARLRNFVKHLPEQRLRFGADMVVEPVPTTTTEIKDRDGFIEAARRAADLGEAFDENDYVKTRTGTPIRPRKLSAAELAEENETEDAA